MHLLTLCNASNEMDNKWIIRTLLHILSGKKQHIQWVVSTVICFATSHLPGDMQISLSLCCSAHLGLRVLDKITNFCSIQGSTVLCMLIWYTVSPSPVTNVHMHEHGSYHPLNSVN